MTVTHTAEKAAPADTALVSWAIGQDPGVVQPGMTMAQSTGHEGPAVFQPDPLGLTGAVTTQEQSRPDLLEWSDEKLFALVDEAHRLVLKSGKSVRGPQRAA